MDAPERRVLVVDDEPSLVLATKMALTDAGWSVATATTGEEALDHLERCRVDVMVLDLRLPGLDGLEVLRVVRDEHPNVRVLVMSAYGTVEAAVEALVLGASDFLRKPFNPEELVQVLDDVWSQVGDGAKVRQQFERQCALARSRLAERRARAALEHARRAVALDPLRPEGFNLLGAASELLNQRLHAQKMYRVALELQPGYRPASANLDRLVLRRGEGELEVG